MPLPPSDPPKSRSGAERPGGYRNTDELIQQEQREDIEEDRRHEGLNTPNHDPRPLNPRRRK